jgi:hypothetical protein
VHDGIEMARLEDAVETGRIPSISHDQPGLAGDGLLAAFAEIVQHRYCVPGLEQALRTTLLM